VLDAFALGFIAQSSLFIAGLLVFWVRFPQRVVGALAGFGAGTMLAAISFDLIAEAEGLDGWQLALWMLVGVLIFIVGDRMVERHFGDDGTGKPMGIIVGSVVDGVPESMILGIQIATAFPVSPTFIAAVFVSNIPQAVAPSVELAAAGWTKGRLARVWGSVVVACGVAAALGYVLAEASRDANGTRLAALAAGGLLAMLANSLIPFAYERGGELAGVATVVGFCVSIVGL
jgi:zinc transporter, ZIP family